MLNTGSRSSSVFGSGTKRKTLVVSGIERNDIDAMEGLRVWCEVRICFCPLPAQMQSIPRVTSDKVYFRRGSVN